MAADYFGGNDKFSYCSNFYQFQQGLRYPGEYDTCSKNLLRGIRVSGRWY